jgi:hypothetical protein
VAYLEEILTDPLTKKTVPDCHHHGGLQQHPQGGRQERVLMVLARLEEVIGTKGDFIRLKPGHYPTKQVGAVSICCYSYLSCYDHFYFHLKTGVNTPRTLNKGSSLQKVACTMHNSSVNSAVCISYTVPTTVVKLNLKGVRGETFIKSWCTVKPQV